MIEDYSTITIVGNISFFSGLYTFTALYFDVRDWKYIAAYASIGCFLGSKFLDNN